MTAATGQIPNLTVLSIDGVPFGLLQTMLSKGLMPNLAVLAEKEGMRRMRSAQPAVSCVAWSSFMTGRNPGKHGIYGFVDRAENTYAPLFPNARMMAVENIWELLSRAGKRVFGMNVPVTYPPRAVNGILIGGFLTPTLDRAAYPASVNDYLKSIRYRIDADASFGRQDRCAMLADLGEVLDRRMEAMFYFLERERWDFFHAHIMESDRINHFFLKELLREDGEYGPACFAFYRRIDEAIGRLLEWIGPEAPLLILSDHGFCPVRREVQLSRYLAQTGWSKPAARVRHALSIDPGSSRAYCLIPGRIFINLQGREPEGIVPVEAYGQVREAIKADILKMRDPETDAPVIERVLMREDLYWPEGSSGVRAVSPEEAARARGTYGKAADLIAVPCDGYDLKTGLDDREVFREARLEGMHTHSDAFILSRGIDLPADDLDIMMLARPALESLGVKPPDDMDGA